MDSTANDIEFDQFGRCNYCKNFENILKTTKFHADGKLRTKKLDKLISKIKKSGRNNQYDCIVGISGGVDSAWVLHKTIQFGLRPLVVHMDNGWNSELAANNIYKLIDKLNVDLFTYVIEWEEYRNLMQAFFDADVIDIELLYDNALWGVTYSQAKKHGIKYILAGTNMATEGLAMPREWAWHNKWDAANIKDIAKTFDVKIKTYPLFSSFKWLKYTYLNRIKWISIIDYLESYKKQEALDLLSDQYGFKPYPYKHYESIFTRFYQGYILPNKFNVDKRKVHLSTLITSGQLTRQNALNQMKEIPYPSQIELDRDKDYFLKKLNWLDQDLQNYLQRPSMSHSFYATEFIKKWIWPILSLINKPVLKLKNYIS